LLAFSILVSDSTILILRYGIRVILANEKLKEATARFINQRVHDMISEFNEYLRMLRPELNLTTKDSLRLLNDLKEHMRVGWCGDCGGVDIDVGIIDAGEADAESRHARNAVVKT